MGDGVKKKTKKKTSSSTTRRRSPKNKKPIVLPPLPHMDPASKRNIVVVGGGIIGSTTAYFLSRHPKYNPALHRITILEASTIAAGASGKAGGLLARWAYPPSLVDLSYALHAKLAVEHDGPSRWGYRRLDCGSFNATITPEKLAAVRKAKAAQTQAPSADLPAAAAAAAPPSEVANDTDEQKDWECLPKQDDAAKELLTDSKLPPDLNWVDREVVESWRDMGHPGNNETAQVHPFHFTTSIAALAQEKGVEVRLRAKVTGITPSATQGLHTVEYLDRDADETKTIEDVTDVVVTAGPWTGRVLPKTKVTGLRAHSVVYDADVSPHAVFTQVQLPEEYIPEHRAQKGQKRKHSHWVDPEIYARPFSEVYACGEPDHLVPLPETADLVQVEEAYCDDLLAYISLFSPPLAKAPVKARQACYLPQREGGPLVGPTSTPGIWVAAGHTCWGIQNGPATGQLMAEYLLDGKATSSNISELDPRTYSRA